MNLALLKSMPKEWISFLKYRFGVNAKIEKKAKLADHPSALHIIIPHCMNWALTEASVQAYSRLTKRPFAITIVNNFDLSPIPQSLKTCPDVSLILNQWNALGETFRKIYSERHGSHENAIGIDMALKKFCKHEWAFMSHSDSAPLMNGWDEEFFRSKNQGLIIGNFKDRKRIHAVHASGTLFHQTTFLQKKGSMQPKYLYGKQVLDVGDAATVLLTEGKFNSSTNVLPNSINDPSVITDLKKINPLLASFAQDGSAISLSIDRSKVVFGHLGRGTPRSMSDPKFQKKLPQQVWIEYLSTLQ